MKTILAVLFLCSVAGLPVVSAQQSSGLSRPMTIEFPKPSPNISIVAPGGKTAVTINTETGEIKYGEGFTPTGAARIFYEAVGRIFRANNCDAQAGAKPEATGKPDSEKPEKKLK